jgi:hypothetical protein
LHTPTATGGLVGLSTPSVSEIPPKQAVGALGAKLLADRPDDRACGRAATRGRPITSVPGKQPQPTPHNVDHVLIVAVTGPGIALPPIRNRSGERPGSAVVQLAGQPPRTTTLRVSLS